MHDYVCFGDKISFYSLTGICEMALSMYAFDQTYKRNTLGVENCYSIYNNKI